MASTVAGSTGVKFSLALRSLVVLNAVALDAPSLAMVATQVFALPKLGNRPRQIVGLHDSAPYWPVPLDCTRNAGPEEEVLLVLAMRTVALPKLPV